MSDTSKQPHVVIIGGGFGGLHAALALARRAVRVTVVDRNNYHLFQPLLYQVATAALSPGDIAGPIRSILRRFPNASVLMAEAKSIDLAARRVHLADGGELGYDYLVLAAGATSTYFGHDEWAPLAPSLKSINDALTMRNRILAAYEAAEREGDPQKRVAWLTFVVVGGGPTGVELAGAIAEIARHTLKRDFRNFDPARSRILLLQSNPRVLPEFAEDLSQSAQRQLERLGVEVQTNKRVTGITPDAVQVGDKTIPAKTVLWTAGVAAAPIAKTLGAPLDKSGRVLVEADLTVPGHPEAYVIGNLAVFTHQGKAPLPGLAPVAMQQGRAAAANIWRTVQGQAREKFVYQDKGSMATIGRAAAVAQTKKLHLSGFAAWMTWLLIHLYFLIGFDNRVAVLFSWAWSYFTYQRGARLITIPVTNTRPEP